MSPAGALKRELVTLLLFLARQTEITLPVSRESLDGQAKMAFRKVILRVHPDRLGGSMEHAKKVNDTWAKRQSAQRARAAARRRQPLLVHLLLVWLSRPGRKSLQRNRDTESVVRL